MYRRTFLQICIFLFCVTLIILITSISKVSAASPSGKISSTWGSIKDGNYNTKASVKTAPAGTSARDIVVIEAWYAMNGSRNACGGKWYTDMKTGLSYLCGRWNYLASDKNALNYVRGIFGVYAGWSPTNPDVYGYCKSFGVNPPGTVEVGRGGQCFFFINLLLYRSGADTNVAGHCNWSTISKQTAPIESVKTGDVIFTLTGSGEPPYQAKSNHIATVSYRSSDLVCVIESNWVEGTPNGTPGQGEIISYRETTISKLKKSGYRVFTGVAYYNK